MFLLVNKTGTSSNSFQSHFNPMSQDKEKVFYKRQNYTNEKFNFANSASGFFAGGTSIKPFRNRKKWPKKVMGCTRHNGLRGTPISYGNSQRSVLRNS